MNNKYLEKAKKQIPDPKELSIAVSKRARQLAMGARPMVKCPEEDHLDIALYEIAEGLLVLTDEPEDELMENIASS